MPDDSPGQDRTSQVGRTVATGWETHSHVTQYNTRVRRLRTGEIHETYISLLYSERFRKQIEAVHNIAPKRKINWPIESTVARAKGTGAIKEKTQRLGTSERKDCPRRVVENPIGVAGTLRRVLENPFVLQPHHDQTVLVVDSQLRACCRRW